MKEALQILKKTKLFGGLEERVLSEEILPRGQVKTYRKGSCLIAPQQVVNQFGVILSGRVQISHIFSDGSYSLMNVLQPGDLLGADLTCTRSRRSAYHAIASMQTRVLLLPAALLAPGTLGEPVRLELLERMLQMIADENMKKEYRLAILSQKGLRARILTYLTMQAQKRETNTFSIPFSREDLASFLCVNRSALSHALSLMEQEGLISFEKNTFTLHRPAEPMD